MNWFERHGMQDGEWRVAKLDGTICVGRPSPWCSQHWEGLNDNILDGRPAENVVEYLKQEVILHSAGWGACKVCHPDATYDSDRVQAAFAELQAARA